MSSNEVAWGRPKPERADAARNRRLLLDTARTLLDEGGTGCLTMDLLAERSGLGKGTVFRRFGSRAGIFQALLDDSERELQQQVLSGPPPLGPGAPPAERLVAYGTARIRFLARHQAVARATLDGRHVPAGRRPLSEIHLRVLLRELDPPGADVDVLAGQLAYALDGPLMLQVLGAPGPERRPPADADIARFEAGWRYLVERVCGG
ncbi:TetR/AcrR family transcriptional regulator [Promicromonospora citrea]|uniref:TetR family transcriptional regulator n=1 Tax=Promicromonospora citrea TaxID=43677 RepID=A0A8H9L8D4_9MICO|nr:TetR/AcrR family transcriptional regulator [Promicromonospora citrea]NNH53152.1 TetR/AcrR family transcriptional regulator [Promicromonospora citrea]GGM42348.1 TetR family transcriptional regulator [Promicromonospora citrea]